MNPLARAKDKDDISLIVKTLKAQQGLQLKELHAKALEEINLFESIRDYMRKRADLEKTYFDTLETLSKKHGPKKQRRTSLSSKDSPGGLPASLSSGALNDDAASDAGTLVVDDDKDPRGKACRAGLTSASRLAHQAFHTLLSESERQAKFRGKISEALLTEVCEIIKLFNRDKAMILKKQMEYSAKYHEDLQKSYTEAVLAKVTYDKIQKEAESAKLKYEDAIKPKKGALAALSNMMKGDSQERIEKLRKKMKATARKLQEVRNDYFMALEASNAAQTLYYTVDLPNLMKKLDGTYHATLVELLNKYTALESEYAGTLTSSLGVVTSAIDKVHRDRETEIFLAERRTIFELPKALFFQSNGSDEVSDLVCDDFTKVLLQNKLSGLVDREADVSKNITKHEKQLAGLEQMVAVYAKTPEFGDAKSPLEEKLDLEHSLDMLRIEHTRVQAVIARLKGSGVEYIPGMKLGFTRKAIASASFKGDGHEQISLTEGDEVEVLQDMDGGWTQVRAGNLLGLVPTKLIKAVSPAQVNERSGLGPNQVKAIYDYDATDSAELSFRAGDIITVVSTVTDESGDDMWWEGSLKGASGQFPVVFTQGWEQVKAADRRKSASGWAPGGAGAGAAATLGGASSMSGLAGLGGKGGSGRSQVKALFDYEASCEGELSLTAGELYWIVSKDTGSEAWWECEAVTTGTTGQCPNAYVEQITSLHVSSPTLSTPKTKEEVCALYDYAAQNDEELSFSAGDVLVILSKPEEDWWEGSCRGKSGLIPRTYVE